MRILIINTVPTDRNGITNVIFNLYRAMEKQLIRIDYVSINNPTPAYIQEIENGGGQVYVIKRSMRRVFSYVRNLRDVIRQGEYDLVHAHGNSTTLLLEMLAAKLSGCKIRIAHCHSTSCKYKSLHKFLWPAFQVCCNYRLACGDAAGRWLFGKRDFQVINNGVDTERFAFDADIRQQLRQQLGINENHFLIGHVGMFAEVKNHRFLIDVFARLTKKDDRYRLILIGDGELRQEMEQKVADLALQEKILFVGAVNNVPQYLSACDMMVMPSLYEGLPLALIEEQANGLRCIVSDRITTDVDKTGNVVFLPLEDGFERWIQAFEENTQNCDRKKRSQDAIMSIKEAGFNIYTEAAKLTKYYEQAVGLHKE